MPTVTGSLKVPRKLLQGDQARFPAFPSVRQGPACSQAKKLGQSAEGAGLVTPLLAASSLVIESRGNKVKREQDMRLCPFRGNDQEDGPGPWQ